MARIVIIGAGLTGLSAAYHLEQQGFFDYQLFEKDETVGGLCRSVHQDKFTFDYTGHLLHASDPYFRSLIEKVVGMEHLHSINRQSFIYSHETYSRYPFQINLYGLPPSIIAECITGFVSRPISRKAPATFHQWVLKNFGKGIAKNFFFPFQNKIFAYDIRKVTTSWMGRFVPSTSLEQMIQGSIADKPVTTGYNAHFVYPKIGGIQFWIEKLAQQLKNPIQKGFAVESVNLKSKTIHFTNGHTTQFDSLISTMPLDHLLTGLEDNHKGSVLRRAAPKLLCNSVVNFNLGINRKNLSDKHWIYFPEKKYPFYRIGFPHNFAPTAVPEGCSSLYGEFSYLKKPKAPMKKILDQAIGATQELLSFSKEEIITQKIIQIPHAYVIYDEWREKNLPRILQTLEDNNIYSVGRYGGWKYSSMQEAVLDGKAVAEKIIST